MGVYFVFRETNKRMFHHVQIATAINKFYIIFVLLSIGGLPPMVGFLGKVSVIKVTLISVRSIFMIFLLFSSLIILFIYVRFRYLAVSFSPFMPGTQKKKFFFTKNNFYIASVIIIWPAIVF